MTLIRSRPHGKGILDRNKTGPVLYLGDTQKSASQWSDISGRGNHGIVYGAGTPPAATPGALGYLFDGVDDYVNAGNDASLNITGNFSLFCWTKIPPSIRSERIAFKNYYTSAVDNGGFGIQLSAAGYLDGIIGNNSQYFKTGTSTIIDNNAWYNVGMTYDSVDGIILYVNGKVEPGTITGTKVNPKGTAQPFEIGRIFFGGLYYYGIGNIDEVRLYNRTLSTSEIKRYFERTRILFGV